VTHGVAFNLTVTARDSFGNVATGYTGTVHFASTDAAATVNGLTIVGFTYSFVVGDNGAHAFSVVMTTVAPTQTITVSDPGPPALTSAVAAMTVS
jgi:hypothetical protein